MRNIEKMSVALGVALLLFASLPESILAQDGKEAVLAHVEANAGRYGEIAQAMWDLAELGYMEHESAALLESSRRTRGSALKSGSRRCPPRLWRRTGPGVLS